MRSCPSGIPIFDLSQGGYVCCPELALYCAGRWSFRLITLLSFEIFAFGESGGCSFGLISLRLALGFGCLGLIKPSKSMRPAARADSTNSASEKALACSKA